MSAPILVWGAGAIGGTVGAFLSRAGHEVLFVDRAADHVARIDEAGLRITGPVAEFTAKARAATPEQVSGQFGTILLCVKAQDTESAARALLPHLARDGAVVSLQNGLNERVIAPIIGKLRTIGAFINFGADYMEPGVVHYGGRGAVVVGEIDGAVRARTEALHAMLRQFDDRAVLTQNIWGYLWAKLAYGAMLFATALTNDSIADCLAAPAHRGLFISLAREVLAVADKAGITPEAFDGFDPTAFRPGGSDAAAEKSLDALVAFNRRSAKTHSGIWRDLAVRKRRTEADAQLGPIVSIAAEQGMTAPITSRLIALVHEIEDGQRRMETRNLDVLAEAVPA
jgi:2-dehydropantoate 2-reductase